MAVVDLESLGPTSRRINECERTGAECSEYCDDMAVQKNTKYEHKSRTRIISFNAMSTKRPGRWDDVKHFLGKNDVIGIQGTSTRSKPGQTYTVKDLGNFEVIEWGYATGKPYTNKACGVSIMLTKKKFPRSTWCTILAYSIDCWENRSGKNKNERDRCLLHHVLCSD